MNSVKNEPVIEQFWDEYLATLPDDHVHRFSPLPEAWHFGDSAQMADDLGGLVVSGRKTATCSRYQGENILDEAGLSIVLGGDGAPLCLIDTIELTVRRYCDVDEAFAAEEGEGDLSLAYWRKAHWGFFTRESKSEGYEVHEEMLLCCERFRVLYRPTT